MCGIIGVRSWEGPVDAERLAIARDAMTPRGPDDHGLWTGEQIALGHRRLAVIDLTEHGRMPMADESGAIHVVFNGEIYNHRELRRSLCSKGYRYRSDTDSESLVHGFAEWGLGLFDRIEGMFAVGIWDQRSETLVLARDPAGEKPLFYAHEPGRRLLFGSSLDALLAHPGNWQADPESLRSYLSFGFVPAPATILKGVRKVEPGTSLVFDREGTVARREFFSLVREYRDRRRPAGRTLEERVDQLDEVLFRAVEQRMEADVPLGAFLSGGIDSSLVCAMMARARPSGVRAFTIGFTEAEYDESPYAMAVARHLGLESVTRTIASEDVLAEIPSVVAALDEPMADTSALPTLAVSRLARDELTVALTGDGADELFGGYRYYTAMRAFTAWARVPRRLRRKLAKLGSWVAHPGVRRIIARSDAMDPGEFFGRSGFYRGPTSERSLNYLLPARELDPVEVVRAFVNEQSEQLHPVEAGMLWDASTTLPDAWLCKVDRCSMSVSLETRAPFLAPSVMRMAIGLPLADKVGFRERKVILKRLLARYVPRELVDRPKRGFSPPMSSWLRGVLRDEVQALSPVGGVSTAGLRLVIDEHLNEQYDHGQAIWALLLLRRWLNRRGIG